MILGFLFFIQTFLKHCKALSTEKYRRYINIFIIIYYLMDCNVDHSLLWWERKEVHTLFTSLWVTGKQNSAFLLLYVSEQRVLTSV